VDVESCDIPGVRIIRPRRFVDRRGFFAELWNDRAFRDRIAEVSFVQDNYSYSAGRGTVRGLHFQTPPHAQGKLIRVVRGAVFDVVVDIRHGSPSFGRHLATRLDADTGALLWVPAGLMHGFCSLEDATEVLYKVTAYYSAEHDAGVVWDDPDLGIAWPVEPRAAILSEKDRQLPRFRDLPKLFTFGG
jgi:dTDP-4-dehydrorhamnose 3,5-epimerase